MPETQTQIIDGTQYGSSESVDDKDQLPEDCKASELKKTLVLSSLTIREKSHTKHVESQLLHLPRTKRKLTTNKLAEMKKSLEGVFRSPVPQAGIEDH